MTQFAIVRSEFGGKEWTSTAVRIVEDGGINEAYRERDRIEESLGLPYIPYRQCPVCYGVRRLTEWVDTGREDYLAVANHILWPHRYGKVEGVA